MNARHAPLILLACAGLGAAGLWLVVGESDAPRSGAVEAEPPPSAARRELVRSPVSEPDPGGEAGLSAPRAASDPALTEAVAPEPAFLGRVVESTGAPVAGALVLALRGNRIAERLAAPEEALRRSPGDGMQALTDGAGRFRLPLAASDAELDFRLAVRASGFAPLDRRVTARAGGELLGDLVLERGVVLSGAVQDGAGRAVVGAVLRGLDLENRSGAPTSSESGEALATTDEKGAFRIDRLASGPWKLLITSEQHPDALQEGETSAPGEEQGGLVFVLADGLEIQGSLQAPPEVLAEALVRALPLSSDGSARPAAPRSARCAVDGSFVVRGLESGWTYRVAAWRGGSERGASGRPDSEWVEAAGGARGVALVLRPERALVFQVVDAGSGYALTTFEVRAGCGFPTPLVGADGRARHEFPDGRAHFPILFECADTPLELWLSAPGYADRIVDDILLAEGQVLDLGVLALEPALTLSVRVLSDAHTAPVEGAEVVVLPAGAAAPDTARSSGTIAPGPAATDAPPWRRARTDRDGRARLNGNLGGVVLVRHPDFSPLVSLPVDASSSLLDLTLHLRSGGRVAVEVVDERGNPVASAWVRHTSVSSAALAAPADTARTARDGRAAFEHLEAGQHRFEVLPAPGAPPAATPVAGELTVSEGGEHGLRLVVPAR